MRLLRSCFGWGLFVPVRSPSTLRSRSSLADWSLPGEHAHALQLFALALRHAVCRLHRSCVCTDHASPRSPRFLGQGPPPRLVGSALSIRRTECRGEAFTLDVAPTRTASAREGGGCSSPLPPDASRARAGLQGQSLCDLYGASACVILSSMCLTTRVVVLHWLHCFSRACF